MLHRKLEDEAGMPEVHADLCFLGDEADPGNTVPVFVMRERLTEMTLAACGSLKVHELSHRQENRGVHEGDRSGPWGSSGKNRSGARDT